QNYPNPFNPSTVIAYTLPGGGRSYDVSLRVYNLLGQEVATLVQQERLAGYHQETFDAQNFASGIYIYQLIATAADGTRFTARRAMVLVK
ncbi:MAG TPA: T9SS type A sorting domain-containing protein, partial [Bacteroidota bacterium]|nr:T9SS type A sorting domain-containing protein [Bacteroidota bacterium]